MRGYLRYVWIRNPVALIAIILYSLQKDPITTSQKTAVFVVITWSLERAWLRSASLCSFLWSVTRPGNKGKLGYIRDISVLLSRRREGGNSPNRIRFPSSPSTEIPSFLHLPCTEPNLQGHTKKARKAYPRRITDTRGAQRKFPIGLGHGIHDLGKRIHIHQSPKQPLPENDDEDPIHVWNEVVEGVKDEDEEVEALKKRGWVQRMDTEEGR